mmetsp:Transcript_5850/g.23678  ORF Transcript_5850/g.23678 Transcript_5850/m.23678 type:complete len:241 (-) Transcript_5850:481-1203(-)
MRGVLRGRNRRGARRGRRDLSRNRLERKRKRRNGGVSPGRASRGSRAVRGRRPGCHLTRAGRGRRGGGGRRFARAAAAAAETEARVSSARLGCFRRGLQDAVFGVRRALRLIGVVAVLERRARRGSGVRRARGASLGEALRQKRGVLHRRGSERGVRHAGVPGNRRRRRRRRRGRRPRRPGDAAGRFASRLEDARPGKVQHCKRVPRGPETVLVPAQEDVRPDAGFGAERRARRDRDPRR